MCKIIIVFMDLAILRGALSMGAEYCSQNDEISSFGWVLWSSFLVFCKFVYLRPVFHLHQLGVFHSSTADARKSAFLEFLCFMCHMGMFLSFAWRAVEPGFTVYVSGSCASRGKALINTPEMCAKAGVVSIAPHRACRRLFVIVHAFLCSARQFSHSTDRKQASERVHE